MALLFSVAACLMFFYHFSQPLPLAAVFGFKLAGLLLASRFIFLTFAFSSGTNDTAKIRLVSMFLVFLVVIFAVSFVALAVASLFWPGQTVAWLCWFLAALEAYGLFRCYGWFYHRNHFDLMNLPRQ